MLRLRLSYVNLFLNKNFFFDFFRTRLASQCPPLPETPSAKQTILSGGGRSYGTIVRFDCDPGYIRSGPPTLLCMSNGTWSGDVPTCSSKMSFFIAV